MHNNYKEMIKKGDLIVTINYLEIHLMDDYKIHHKIKIYKYNNTYITKYTDIFNKQPTYNTINIKNIEQIIPDDYESIQIHKDTEFNYQFLSTEI